MGDVNSIISQFPIVGHVLMGLGGLVVLGQVIVAITPSKSDDAFLAKLQEKPIIGHLLKALMSFAPIQKK